MASKELSDLSRALTSLWSALGWSQSELARAAGVQPNMISDFERGHRPLSRQKLKDLAGVMGLPPESIDWALHFVRPVRQVAQAPGYPAGGAEAGRARIEALAAESAGLSSEFTRSLLSFLTFEGRSLEVREQAPVLWRRMKKRTPSERRALVEDGPEFRSWALCELICKESEKAAADNAGRARELAELALFIAELAIGEASWRRRLQGYAWAHVGNARRVGGNLPGAEEAFSRAGELWQAGASGDPGLLDEAQVLSLEASLRTIQGRLPEATTLLDLALAAAPKALRPNLLIKKARLLEWAGDYEGALAILGDAAPLVLPQEDSRLIFMLRHNHASNLMHLGRYAEAEALLPELQPLAVRLSNELDGVRLRWLKGRIAAGLGKMEEALVALSQVREEFAARGTSYDAALATLELAVLYLDQGRTFEVKMLARQMAPIFRAQGVHCEALAALRLFCEAAEKESATVELARRVTEYLYRAQHNPSLQFEALSWSTGPE